MSSHASVRRVRGALRGPVAVWILTGAIAVCAAVLYQTQVRQLVPLAEPHIPWWVLAFAFAAGERAVLHVHFRRSAHSFSLGDIPLVFGLVFCSGSGLIAAGLVGAALPLVLDRRLPPVKTAFNLAQFALGACVAEIVLNALTSPAADIGPATWLSILVAVEASALVTVVLIGAAIRLSEGSLPPGMLRTMAVRDFMVTMTNTSIALVAAILISLDARAAPLIVIPAFMVFLAYRAYFLERQRHEQLEFLYEATRTLARSPEVVLALDGLLSRSIEAFSAEFAEVVLFSADGQPPLRTSRTMDGHAEAMAAIDAGTADDLAELVRLEGPVVALEAPFGSERLGSYLERQGITHAMIAALRTDERTVGTLMVANRPGVVRRFDPADLKLLEALANNTSVALQFDRLEQSIWQLRELQQQLQHQAFHDPLTDLANRALFNNQVRDALARETGPMAVLFIDVDDFKVVNDTLGHQAGDDLLTLIAERLRASVLPTDVVARLGGDEFAILLRHVGDPEDAARAVAERILSSFEPPAVADGHHVRVRLTIGIATGRPGVDHADEVVRNADVAMYHAKRAGKNSWLVFQPSMHTAILEHHGLHAELERAIDEERLSVAYQPVVGLADGRLMAVEALARWERAGAGPVLPSTFVPLAEQSGLIQALDGFVLRRACREAQAWVSEGLVDEDFGMHVNLSAAELQDPELVARVEAVLRETGLPPRHLVLELTESAVLRDTVRGAEQLTQLRDLGVRLALDDFGTGYSSLSHLRSLPFDMLKIARPFVEGATQHPQEESFLRMMLELGRTLGLKVVAEGIETDRQLALVQGLACDLGQGFLLGRPMPAADLRAELATGTAPYRTRVAIS